VLRAGSRIAPRVVAPLLLLAAACAGGHRAAGPVAPAGAGVTPLPSGTLVLPRGYDPARRYPVVVMLPASNGTSEAMWRAYAPAGVIIVLSAGVGSMDDYRTNEAWARTIARYERQLREDLAVLFRSGRADTTRVVLAGFSMGGDLSWALALRNPTLVSGAVVMGSRMSYRGQPGDLATLALRNARFFVIMGGMEDRTRLAGAQSATRLLATWGLAHEYREVPGLAHLRAPGDVFREGLDFVLGVRATDAR